MKAIQVGILCLVLLLGAARAEDAGADVPMAQEIAALKARVARLEKLVADLTERVAMLEGGAPLVAEQTAPGDEDKTDVPRPLHDAFIGRFHADNTHRRAEVVIGDGAWSDKTGRWLGRVSGIVRVRPGGVGDWRAYRVVSAAMIDGQARVLIVSGDDKIEMTFNGNTHRPQLVANIDGVYFAMDKAR